MTVYFDKTHRIKKIDGWWVPHWKRGFLRWDRYKLMVADTAMGSIELYSESWCDVMFHTELQVTRFMEKAMTQGYEGKLYVMSNDCLPVGIKEW